MNSKQTIARNFPWHSEYDDTSFLGRLCEECIWDINEYFLLESALYELTASEVYDPQTTWHIFRIFSLTAMLLSAHFDTNDGFKIENLSREDIYDFRERFQLVFEGYFQRKMPKQDIFETVNPLIQDNNK